MGKFKASSPVDQQIEDILEELEEVFEEVVYQVSIKVGISRYEPDEILEVAELMKPHFLKAVVQAVRHGRGK